jgi:hypothetical protein
LTKPGRDADGVAQKEADHYAKCPGCGEWLDVRDLGQVFKHIHDGKDETGNGELAGAGSLKPQSNCGATTAS